MTLTREEELAAEKVAENIISFCRRTGMKIDACVGAKIDGLLGVADISNNLPQGRAKECADKIVEIANEVEDKVRMIRGLSVWPFRVFKFRRHN